MGIFEALVKLEALHKDGELSDAQYAAAQDTTIAEHAASVAPPTADGASRTFHGLTQSDIDDPMNRVGHFLAHQFVVYPLGRDLPHDKWDTHCHSTFCSNCIKVKSNSVTERWECLGH